MKEGRGGERERDEEKRGKEREREEERRGDRVQPSTRRWTVKKSDAMNELIN